MEIKRLGLEEWERALPATDTEPFYRPAALSVLDDHAAGELRLLGGFKGDRPVGLLPVFVRSLPASRAVVSPPPGLGVPRLGPIVMPASPKRRKRERVNRTFIEGVFEELGVERRLTMTRIVGSPAYVDPRPFRWQSLSVSTSFTYRVDATDPETTRAEFSKSLRREIRDAEALDVTVEREGATGAASVYRDAADRYDDQGESLCFTAEYVDDLVTALDDRARTYVARDGDGDYLGGIVVVYSGDAAYFWLGGTKAVHEGTSINSLIHWHILEDIAEDPPVETVTEYDLMGANTERLCQYKAKFGGDLVPYYVVESDGLLLPLAKRAYQLAVK